VSGAGPSRAPADGLRADLLARSLGRGGLLCSVGSIGLAIDLQDDRRIHDPVQERHRQRRVAQVIAPGLEIDVRHQRRRPRGTCVDQLVQQARRLGRFSPLDSVKAELVKDHQVELRVVA